MARTVSGQWVDTEMVEPNGDVRPSARRADSSSYSASKGVRRVPSDAWNIMSDSEETKVRRQSLKANNSSATKKRSRNTLREKKKADDPVDDSQWIHRDKLAEIEIKEMEAAGIDVRPYRRSMSAGPGASARSSRSQSRSRRPSKDKTAEQMTDEEYSAAYPMQEDSERKRISTIPAADEEEQAFDPNVDTEFRTPAEVAAELRTVRSSNVIRPSTSRIPLSKASPVPVPSTVVDRDSPLPRSRGNSNAWSGNPNWDEMQYARKARSNSIGSQALLDDDGTTTPPRPGSSNMGSSGDNNSSPKARVPGKATPTSRKLSTPNGSTGNRTRTSGTKENRPVSRGHQSRPSTSRAPEGEAPWIASMYKPDPRLPPDQQMLPTHAKRMMQEQWEKEGKTGTTYDRDLRLINDNELPVQKTKPLPMTPLSPKSPSQLNAAANDHSNDPGKPSPALSPGLQSPGSAPGSAGLNDINAWPLTPKSETPSSRPGTSGGYKITPTITTPPAIQKSPSPAPPGPSAQPHNPTPRVPDYDEKDEPKGKKGGCGCCVVM